MGYRSTALLLFLPATMRLIRLLAQLVERVRRWRSLHGLSTPKDEEDRLPFTAGVRVEAAKEVIFDRLCREFKKRGPGASLDATALREELGLPDDVFRWALSEMTAGYGSLWIDHDYERKRVWLGTRGWRYCQDGINPFKKERLGYD